MKISCQSCGAKYNIADEKVRGKIVKIACKKCGARIEIDGREPSEQSTDHDETRVYEAGQLPTGTTVVADSWTVSIDDNDQREVNTQALIDLYAQGVVSPDTFVWREGMADWQPVRDVDALRDALAGAGGGAAAAAPAPAYAEPAAPAYGNYEEPATVMAPAVASPLASGGGYGAPEPAAARLGDARRGGAVDLFASPGGGHEDEDVATSAPAGGSMGFGAVGGGLASASDGKPIGARNENSVLFSLSALTSSGPANAAPSAATEDEKSGLIDIQKLAAAAKPNGGDDRAKLDDIMNLGGGGAFGAALGAPILAPPPETALTAPAEPEKKKGNGLLIAIVAVMGAAIIALLVVLLLRKPEAPAADAKKDDEKGLKTEPAASTEKTAKPKATATDEVVATPTPTATASASASAGTKPTATVKATATVAVTAKPTNTGAAPPATTAAPPPTTPPVVKKKCATLDECMGMPK
jgi:predicted Zn finger-like uncharacterized protein